MAFSITDSVSGLWFPACQAVWLRRPSCAQGYKVDCSSVHFIVHCSPFHCTGVHSTALYCTIQCTCTALHCTCTCTIHRSTQPNCKHCVILHTESHKVFAVSLKQQFCHLKRCMDCFQSVHQNSTSSLCGLGERF